MKKTLITVLLFLLTVTLFVACSSSPAEEQENVAEETLIMKITSIREGVTDSVYYIYDNDVLGTKGQALVNEWDSASFTFTCNNQECSGYFSYVKGEDPEELDGELVQFGGACMTDSSCGLTGLGVAFDDTVKTLSFTKGTYIFYDFENLSQPCGVLEVYNDCSCEVVIQGVD